MFSVSLFSQINIVHFILGFIFCFSVLNMYIPSGYMLALVAWGVIFLINIITGRRLVLNIPNITKVGIGQFLCVLFLLALHTKDFVDISVTVYFIVFSLFFPMTLAFKNDKDFVLGLKLALVLILLAGLGYSSYQSFILHVDRPSGLMQNANVWAGFLELVLPHFLFIAYDIWRKSNRKVSFIVCLVLILNVFLVKTRGLYLSIIVCSLLYALVYLHQKNRKIFYIAFVLFCVILIYLLTHAQILMTRNYDIQRLNAYSGSWRMWLDNPIFGVGFGEWSYVYNSFYYYTETPDILPHAHNMYLQYLSTTGIIGFCSMLYFYATQIKFFSQEIRLQNYYIVGLCGISLFLIHGCFDSILSVKAFQPVFWMILGIYYYDHME